MQRDLAAARGPVPQPAPPTSSIGPSLPGPSPVSYLPPPPIAFNTVHTMLPPPPPPVMLAPVPLMTPPPPPAAYLPPPMMPVPMAYPSFPVPQPQILQPQPPQQQEVLSVAPTVVTQAPAKKAKVAEAGKSFTYIPASILSLIILTQPSQHV